MKKGFANNVPAVVLGSGINGLNIIRSLGIRGIPIINATIPSLDYSLKSRYTQKVYYKSLTGEDCLTALFNLAEKLKEKAVLYCTSDMDVMSVSKYRDQLHQYYHIILPPHGVIKTLMEKRLFHNFAIKNNLPVPKTYYSTKNDEIEKISNIVEYPCVIKPQYHDEYWNSNMLSKYGIKVLFAKNKDVFCNYFKRYDIGDRPLVIQEWIEGGDKDVFFGLSYIDRYNRPLAVFTGRKIRQYPPFIGSTSLAESLCYPEVAEKTLKTLSSVGCIGICSVEFKRCKETKKLFITEPTVGRVDTQEGISTKSGMDIPYLSYLDAIGRSPEPLMHFREGIKWINESYELYSVKHYFKDGLKINKLIYDYKGERSYALWSFDDPMPFFAFITDVLKKLFGKIIMRLKCSTVIKTKSGDC